MADQAQEGADPSELPDEKVHALVDSLIDAHRSVGLYCIGAVVREDGTPDEELEPGTERYHRLFMQFTMGDIAWADRTQNPENAEMLDTFRAIEHATMEEEYEDIRRQLQERKERRERGERER